MYLQALNALLFPINMADESATQATQHKFITSGCISALLDAVNEGNNAGGGLLLPIMKPASQFLDHRHFFPIRLIPFRAASPVTTTTEILDLQFSHADLRPNVNIQNVAFYPF